MFMLVASFCAYVEGVGTVCENRVLEALGPAECGIMVSQVVRAIQSDLAERQAPLIGIAVGCMPQAEA
ncbi:MULTISPECIES: hypothetical protein [unclassified Sulfitobacter]|jgi:hypothetical protein|uniref:hypothetical protein n=1 Tax=unclassified Sulfitobacter TaxID=196795 RepID=UPI0007C244ED|nr:MULTISPECIES: hypothetical protein [unclassified Sulfitobacter]KZY26818.1 hypothetical protein A3728_14710 [Sulfitobacter sp. HI0040]KZZ67954.1 hypothetical protein A3764_13925 [Sulfitobacter sp. HI0129]